MKLNNKSEELAREITPTRIRKYLLGTGWKEDTVWKADAKKDTINIFYYKDNHQDQILLPEDTDFLDYARRIKELIEHLASLQNRDEVSIFNELLLPASDVIRVSIDNKDTKSGTLPFNDGINLLPNVKQMLYASAMSLIKPNTYFKVLKNKDVEKFIDSCRWGQTERGSFVASVICPIDPQLTLTGERVNNFGRETTANMMNSLSNLTDSIDRHAKEGTIDKSIKEEKFNYNFCSALIELQPEEKDSNISISVNWAPEDKPKVLVPSQVTVRKEHYEQLPKIIEKIRPRDKPLYEEFVGRVSALVGQEDKNEKLIKGDIILALIGRDDRIIRTRVFLNRKDYELACILHKDNKKISIKGKLVWAARVRRLEDYNDFKVISS